MNSSVIRGGGGGTLSARFLNMDSFSSRARGTASLSTNSMYAKLCECQQVRLQTQCCTYIYIYIYIYSDSALLHAR
jgi:hypothetical protein